MDKLSIKRYANRRLYDPEKSAYVTLDDLARTIRDGRPVEVRDARNNEDVTALILTQILLEQSRRKNSLLPVPVLHLLIRFGETDLHEFFQNYLEQTLQAYLQYRHMADEQFRQWLRLGKDLSGPSVPPGPLEALQSLWELLAKTGKPPSP